MNAAGLRKKYNCDKIKTKATANPIGVLGRLFGDIPNGGKKSKPLYLYIN